MSDVLTEIKDHVFIMTLNRTSKHNAFDDALLNDMQQGLDAANENNDVRVLVLKANGRHFSAGADLNWMQRMADYSEAENQSDAKVLAKLMYTLHQSPKPTIVAVQGAAFGGGVGLVAACDIAVGAQQSKFCFSEVKLGLIPAVISPYVIKAIGARAASWLFMSAEVFDAQRAYELQLIHYCVPDEELIHFTLELAQKMAQHAPLALRDCKSLVHDIADKPINQDVMDKTAALIAKKRVSHEGQTGLKSFLDKKKPSWD